MLSSYSARVAAFVFFALVLVWGTVLGAIAGYRGLYGETETAAAGGSLWELTATAAASGVLAYAVTEFMKRLSPLRSVFNERAVRKYWGYESERRKNELRITFEGRLPQIVAQLASHEREHLGGPPEAMEWQSRDIESRLDAFQIVATVRWRRVLRIISAFWAAAVMVLAVASFEGDGPALTLAVIVGLVVGGPISWTVYDLVSRIAGSSD
jgi:hypothetical protein